MICVEYKYVIINEKKEPQHSLDKTYTYDEIKDYDNVAILVDEPYVVIDMDDADEAVALFNIIDKLHLKNKNNEDGSWMSLLV